MTKELYITQCPDKLMWYAGMIGKRVPLVRVLSNKYESQEPTGYINYVELDDAEIVDCVDVADVAVDVSVNKSINDKITILKAFLDGIPVENTEKSDNTSWKLLPLQYEDWNFERYKYRIAPYKKELIINIFDNGMMVIYDTLEDAKRNTNNAKYVGLIYTLKTPPVSLKIE